MYLIFVVLVAMLTLLLRRLLDIQMAKASYAPGHIMPDVEHFQSSTSATQASATGALSTASALKTANGLSSGSGNTSTKVVMSDATSVDVRRSEPEPYESTYQEECQDEKGCPNFAGLSASVREAGNIGDMVGQNELLADPAELLARIQAQRNIHEVPNQGADEQGKFASWLYTHKGSTCKEGNLFQCYKGISA